MHMQQQLLLIAKEYLDCGVRTFVRGVRVVNAFIFIPVYSSPETFSEAGVSTRLGVASGSKSLFSPRFFINRFASFY